MKQLIILCCILALLMGCKEETSTKQPQAPKWDKHFAGEILPDSLQTGKTHLSVYSQIYSRTEHITHALTATVSMRNLSEKDTLYLSRAEYFDTSGNSVRNFIDRLIYIKPMETAEIVIEEVDMSGGTGGNIVFDWHKKPSSAGPHFECVMISTSGQQGLSFTTTGVDMVE